ncbi:MULTISPECIES: acyl carrier protein [Euryhalocaulis]|uniref:acyl carrier protein n=1 Tax=Euryhalocaulis TaxID=1712422 RepID=UPI0003A51991|nr:MULTISPECIES: acyl carrier protein [Euryhalocaulis]MBA4802208.1 acyl carrier protein [Euryhalocaulis sp.]
MSTANAQTKSADLADDLVYRRILQTLEPFNQHNVKLTPETDIATELELDSIAVMDLVMEVEDVYDISFPINVISEIRTVRELTEAVHAIKRGEAG